MPIKLSATEADLFLAEHIPYRLNQLFGFQHYRTMLCNRLSTTQQRLIGPSVVEGSAIAGRQLAIVLGIACTTSGLGVQTKWQARDVNLESFGLPLVPISTIPSGVKQVLETFLFQANKSTAHLTLSEDPMDGWTCLPRAADIIKGLLEVHLYRPLRASMTSW